MKQVNLDTFSDTFFNSLPGNIVVVDNRGKIVKVNLNWNKFAIENGIDPGIEWMGQNYLEVCKKLTGISNESAGEACKAIKAILRGEESDFELEYPGRKSNKEQWFRMQASGFQYEDSFYATIIHEDVSEYSNAELALKESENKFRSLFDKAGHAMSVSLKADGIRTEISEKNLSEHQTEKSELDFNLLVNSSPGVIYKCSLDDPWLMHFISDKIEILSGYPKEDFLGLNPIRPFGELMHPDDREEASRLVQIAIDKKESYKLAYRVIHKDGHINYVFGYGQANYNSDGSPDYLVGIIFNDTDRVVAVNKVKESEEKYRNLIEHLKDGVILIQDDVVKFTNQTICDLTGYTAEEFIGKRFIDFINLDELSNVLDKYNNRDLSSGWEPYEISLGLKNGNNLDFEFTAAPSTFQGEDAILVLARDISERKKVEEALIESEEKFRLLVAQSPLPINIFNPDGFLDEANLSWQKMWGLSDDGLKDVLKNYNLLEDKMSIELGLMPYIEKAFQGEATILPLVEFDGVETMRRFGIQLNAEKLWILISYYPVKDSNGKVVKVVGLIDDFTQTKQKEQEILQYQRRLKDQSLELTLTEEKQRKEIAVDLHDQVGQLLAYSRMQLAALTPNLSKEEILDKTGDISKGLLSAIETTRSVIFDLSPPQLEELGLYAAIADWMEEEIEKQSNIQTSISGDEQIYPLNENVRILLFRCVRELLINTLKHSGAKKLNVHFEHKIKELQITVSDNGIGFSYKPEKLKLKQTGFGLFSVQERINDLGGDVNIFTSPGNGTQIELVIPTK